MWDGAIFGTERLSLLALLPTHLVTTRITQGYNNYTSQACVCICVCVHVYGWVCMHVCSVCVSGQHLSSIVVI